MYTNTGYRLRSDFEIKDNKGFLTVESCGVYRLLKQKVMITDRPKGRADYQLIYVHTGKVYFMLDGERLEISAGYLLLYRPYEPQQYVYYLEDLPEVYWIHFTGMGADELLAYAGFSEKRYIYIGNSTYYTQTFLELIHELQVQRFCFEELTAIIFRQFLLKVRRAVLERSDHKGCLSPEVERAIHYFNENYAKTIMVESYAKENHMSISWFIRSFRQHTGMTPLQYIIAIRMEKAKELLQGTTYNINEISTIVGYDNALYFSRIFKKQEGMSPLMYKKINGMKEGSISDKNKDFGKL